MDNVVSIFLIPAWEIVIDGFSYLWDFMGIYTVYLVVFFVLFGSMYFFKFIIHILKLK